jgi:DNA-binding SARP family transcriptional activator
LTTSRGEVGFNPQSNHWLDVEVFEEISGQILAKPFESLETKDVVKLEDALKLYTGELLEGFYEDWALRERERLRSLYLHSLIHLLQFYRHQQAFEMSLACCHKIIDLDPLREEIHREMMRLYYRNGQRALALRQYEKCRETLALELGVAPMEETQILYAQISKKTGGGLPPLDQQLDLITAHNILAQLRRNIHDFEKSTDMLRHSAKNLEGVIKGRK